MIAALAMLVASVVTGTALAVDGGSVSDAEVGNSQTDTGVDTDSSADGGEVEAEGEGGSAAAEDADDVASGAGDAEGYSAASDGADLSDAASAEVGGPGSFMVSVPVSDGDDAGSIGVTVDVPEGAFDGGVTLLASMVADDDGVVAEALADADITYDGLLALDVRFEDSDGVEVEPVQPVDVTFELPAGALGGDVDASSIVVSHLVEDADGNIESVDTVADAGDASDGTVTLDGVTALSADSEVSDSSTVTMEFTVDSFSTFTIRYGNNTITVHFVDLSGSELPIDVSAFDDLSNKFDPRDFEYKYIYDMWVNVEELASTWAYVTTGYTFQKACCGSDWNSSQQFYWIRYNRNAGNNQHWRYSTSTDAPLRSNSGENWNTGYQIYLVYVPVTESVQYGALQIEDNVAEDGTFTATYTGEYDDSDSLYYVWQEWDTDSNAWTTIEQWKVTGNEWLLSDDGSVFNVVLQVVNDGDDAGGGWYCVSVYESEDEYESGAAVLATSASYQLSYYDELQNGSFESPDVNAIATGNKSNYQYPVGTDGLIWRTTGSDQQIEIVNGPNDTATGTRYNNSYGAYADDQYAELNCEDAGALYQDVLTVPESTLNWRFSHRGRSGPDTMYLLIAATEAVEGITSQGDLMSLVEKIQESGERDNDTGDYTYTSSNYTYYLVSKTTDNTRWEQRTGTYTVPDGQYLTRFFFVAGDVASNDPSVGNLLDDVYFTTSLLPADAGTANLQITKVIEGVDQNADLSGYTITVKVSGNGIDEQTVIIRDFTYQRNGTWTASGYIESITVNANNSVDLTVTEESPGSPGGYSYTSTTASVNGGEEVELNDNLSTSITLEEQDTGVVTFTNSYSRIVQPVSSLPLTGGSGTGLQLLLMGGMLGLLAAGAWLLARRRGAMV